MESEGPNKGSIFTVTLPLASASAAEQTNNPEVCEQENGQPFGAAKMLEGLRILVVDDELDSRELVSAILTRCGSEVRCSESAADAMQAFKEWQPDIVISDIGMPVEDGYSFIKRLRKLRTKRAKQIPAVALTAYVNRQDKARALAAGFQAHIAKPVEPEALVKWIAEATGRKG